MQNHFVGRFNILSGGSDGSHVAGLLSTGIKENGFFLFEMGLPICRLKYLQYTDQRDLFQL
ncbi:MAG: hypothetical protein IPJ20_23005 [Flammeovirgaceae bacterium]|nr:hypothetical protein [Flammeovirgaceae bacterium]